jgi:hypothetical protein
MAEGCPAPSAKCGKSCDRNAKRIDGAFVGPGRSHTPGAWIETQRLTRRSGITSCRSPTQPKPTLRARLPPQSGVLARRRAPLCCCASCTFLLKTISPPSKALTSTIRSACSFRLEALNFINRVQFGFPNIVDGSSTFGDITSQANLLRNVQVSLKLFF